MPKKARKVEQLQIECPACGAINAVDRKTGEVIGYAPHGGAPAPAPDDPPASDQGNPSDPADVPADGEADEDAFLADW